MSGIALDRWLRHLEDHLPIARRGVDPEGTHQMRVAIARLRVWLALGGWHVLQDDLRWLRRRLAAVRDLDVQLQRDLPESWAASLRVRRAEARRELVVVLDDPRLDGLVQALSLLPPVSVDRAQDALPGLADEALRIARRIRTARADLPLLHRVRRAVRRVRFALEWLDKDAADLVRVQDSLGDACDACVALQSLGRRRGKGLRRYRADLTSAGRRARRSARNALRRARPFLEDLACSST